MPTYQLILFVFACAVAARVRADDWTASCPVGCVCKWTNGKKSVKCNDQQLTGIPPMLHTDVQSLQLNGNNIASLAREEFTALGLVNLQRIYLKRSHIANISRDAFRNLKILVEIDLSENAIETLDKQTFNGNDRLRYLYLYGNPLKRLAAFQFPALPHLRTLDLHDCQISQIDATAFANLELLELLNLKNNLVEIVDEHVFNYMKNLKTLVLEGNPWKCNCKLRRFRNWYINSNLNSLSLMCSSPFVFKNKQWEEVEEIQFACPPKVDIYTDNIYNIDIGSNVTFGCLIYGDPLPAATWDFNGKEFDADNVSVDEELYTDTLWRNLTIFNITNFDAGVYVCSAKNNVGRATANISLTLTEMVQHVIEKGPETFWYFGLILGTFGTVFGLIVLAILVCWCQKATQRRRSLKNIKGSVSFNDQEKKLLDLSITTNDRQDSCEIGGVAREQLQQQQQQQQHVSVNALHHGHQLQHHHLANGIAMEPIQITIESQQHQHQRMGSPMAMAMAMAMVQSNGGGGGGSCIAESTTNTATASNSSTSGQSTSSASSQQSPSVRGLGTAGVQPPTGGGSAAATVGAGTGSHHLRGICPLSHRPLPTFRCGPAGPMAAPYGSIFITLAMNPDDQPPASGTDYHIYPDLLNDTATTAQQQQQQVTSTAFATLPRNRLRSASAASAATAAPASAAAAVGTKFNQCRVHEYEPPDLHACNNLCLQNLINYHNLEARLCNGGGGGGGSDVASSTLCALCLRDTQTSGGPHAHHSHNHHLQQQQQQQHLGQQQQQQHMHQHQHQHQQHHQPYRAATLQRAPSDATDETMASQRRNAKYDNMGRRITASGNSTLSLPDEDDELELCNGLRSTAVSAIAAAAAATTRRGSFAARDTSGSSLAAATTTATTTTTSGTDADSAAAAGAMVPSVSRLVLPVGCDYVSL